MTLTYPRFNPFFKVFFESNGTAWTLHEKIIFRFCCIFFSLNIIPNVVPYPLGNEWLTRFVGRIIFGIETLAKDPSGGSGDSEFDWVWFFTVIALSLIGTFIWSYLDRNRAS